MGIVELNKLNQLRSLVIAKTMSKAGRYGCARYKCKGNLITVYTTSGIKLAEPVPSIGKGNTGFCTEQEKSMLHCQPQREAVIQGLYEVSVAD